MQFEFFEFFVPGKPQGKARARTVRLKSGAVTSFTPERTATYENWIRTCFISEYQKRHGDGLHFPLTGAVEIDINACFAIPKSYSKKKRLECLKDKIWPTVKPDVDNIAKVVCDALNGFAYSDDKQIVSLTINKGFVEPQSEGITAIIWSVTD